MFYLCVYLAECMNKIKNKLLNLYNSLNKKQKLFLYLGIVIILSIIYFGLINNNYRENDINYNKINVQSIIADSELIYDRGIIKTIDDISKKILSVNYNAYYIDNKNVTLNNIYNSTFYSSYMKKISYSKFKKKISLLYKNVLSNDQISSFELKSYINSVSYSKEYDMYLIEFTGIDHNSYLGIRLYSTDGFYKITYIEE